MNEALFPQSFNSLYAQTRIDVFAEPDPTLRTELLMCLVGEGEDDVANFAVAAFLEQPNEADDEPGALSYAKLVSGQILVETLARRGLFEHAEYVVDTLEQLGDPDVYRATDKLLEHGYAGRDERFLHLDFVPEVELARAENREPGSVVFRHIEALASYGLDLFDPTTSWGRLFERSIEASAMQDQRYGGIAYAYAIGGHTYRAMCAKDRISDPYQRAWACVKIAPEVQAIEDLTAADLLIQEADGLLESIPARDDSCGTTGRNRTLDIRHIEARIALVLARGNRLAEAEEKVGASEPAIAYDQSLVHTEIYKRNGGQTAREKALTALVDMSVYHSPEFAGKIIEEIGLADLRWGNVVPSLGAEDKSIPLIAWELNSQWGRKGNMERRAERGDVGEASLLAIRMSGISPGEHAAEMAEKRLQLRDYTLGVLVKLLVQSNTPAEALHLIGLIKNRTERVRAVAAIHSCQT